MRLGIHHTVMKCQLPCPDRHRKPYQIQISDGKYRNCNLPGLQHNKSPTRGGRHAWFYLFVPEALKLQAGAVFGGGRLLLTAEELAEEGLRGEAQLAGYLLNREAGRVEIAPGLAHQIVGNNLFG